MIIKPQAKVGESQERIANCNSLYYDAARSSSSHGESGPPIPGLIGSGPAMQHCYRLVRQVAQSNASVLLLGETGTGKLIAKAIHRLQSAGQWARSSA